MMHRIVLLLVSALTPILCDESIIVEAPAGKFKGHEILRTMSGRSILSFEGIPYAKPPIGELRLKDPVAMPHLDEVFEATNSSVECPQPTMNFTLFHDISTYKGLEDCLYLNIHLPKKVTDIEPLPVFVWFHGGGFFMGSNSRVWQGPEYLLEKDMITVFVNYRLGLLGFLSTGDEVIPGNFGIKDQILALKWVQNNIASFGGDPGSVTIAGESAGGSTTSLLMHSPMSTGLFHKVIAQSGTVSSSYAVKTSQSAKEEAKKIANYLGCEFKSETFLKCVQDKPLEEMNKAFANSIPNELSTIFNFVPVVEDESPKAILTLKSLNKPAQIPFLTGITNREAIYIMNVMTDISDKYHGDFSKIQPDLDKLVPVWGNYNNKKEITEKISKFYFGPGGFPDATRGQATDFLSDVLFNHATHVTAKMEDGPTYMYMLSYKGSSFKFPDVLLESQDVGHGEDIGYLFTSDYILTNWEKADLDFSKQLVDMWYKFAKYGNPTPDTKLWEESNKGVKYLDMTNQGLIMKSNMFKDRMNFLDELHIDRWTAAE